MKQNLNNPPKFAYEFLDKISKAENKQELLWEYAKIPPLNFLLAMNFSPSVVFDLPEGMPPYNRNEADHPDLYAPLSTSIKRMQICLKSNKNTKQIKKEAVFIQILEGINPKEADILVACKDRALNEYYPLITRELVESVYPDLVK